MTRRYVSGRLRARRLARVCAVVAVAAVALAVTSASGWTAVLASGGVQVYDDPGCVKVILLNEPKVTVPFSIGITGLTPFSTDAQIFVTDKDAQPNVVYGPITIPNVDGQGNSCIEVESAPPGHWKIDVVEESSGYNKSKVIKVEGTEPTTTTTTAPTTTTTAPTTTTVPTTSTTTSTVPTTSTTTSTVPPTTTTSTTTTTTVTTTTTTVPSTTTTVPGSTTTTSSTTTTEAPTTTTSVASTTTSTTTPAQTTTTTFSVEAIHRPGSELPWVIVFDPTAQGSPATSTTSGLPVTGAAVGAAIALGSGLVGIGLALRHAGRRR